MSKSAFWFSAFNGKVSKTYRKLLQEMRRKNKESKFLPQVIKSFRSKKRDSKVPNQYDRQLQKYAEDYSVMLASLHTYEQLLKEEGWGEPRNEAEKMKNLANHCGLELPEQVTKLSEDVVGAGQGESMIEKNE
mmetsp:Transcript_22157/g.31022  ORF Transcript_22157/g.31022 Transcript_22157/m.31022 type:complete len:133 (+) Transcript_22157:69-467(+)|eukprot:CAMPEP_0185263356 /NCGR_PEP_ID=MMETSP1359-20130426/14473_1 /TAXON_ID=552665 /ORGANISM="Bigelowiella longifila, Strain CCMP242" /LENGTH=132 /DNA_ID=CAMNT_0027850839 /DNA_START=48 /DNA_END=446 /DNA_ORIENTATION=+